MANEVIIPVKYVVDDSDLSKAGSKIGALTAEEKKLEAEMNDVAAAARKQTTAFNQAGDAGTKAAKDTEKQYNMLGNTMGNIGAMIAGAFAVDRILAFGQKVVEVTATFQKLTAVLTTSLGSKSAAENALARIQQFAAETPYSVEQVTAAFVKLAARGFQPTNAELKKLGDLAASTGKDFDQLTEALLDAQTGEFERLKEFGITARSEGDKVKFTFGETTTVVQKTNEAIKDYVLSLGDLEQVSGSAAAISETLGGKINNLGDTFDSFFKTIGEGSSGVLVGLIDQLNKIVANTTKIIDPIGTATKEAVANVSDFEAAISKSLTNIINKTKAEGGDIEGAVAGQVAKVRNKITSQLAGAQQALEDVNRKVDNIPKALQAFGLPKGLETQLANSTARVKFLQAELQALDAAAKKAIKQDTAGDAASKAAAAKKAKEAAEAAKKAAKEAFESRDVEDIGMAPGIGLDFFKKIGEGIIKETEQNLKLNSEHQERLKDQNIKAASERVEIAKKEAEDKAKADKEYADAKLRLEQDMQSQLSDFGNMAAGLYIQSQLSKTDIEKQAIQDRYDFEIEAAGSNKIARRELEDKENAEIAKIEAKEAKLKQQAALFAIGVEAAQKGFAIKAQAAVLAANPVTAPLVPLALTQLGVLAASVILQTGFVLSQKIPGYLKGVRSVPGRYRGKDEVLAMLAPEERVIKAEDNRKLGPAFDVLTDSKRSPQFWNKTLMEIEKLGVFTPPKLSTIQAMSSGQGVDTDRIVAAVKGIVIERTTFDERGVVRYTERELSRIRKLNKRYGF